MEGRYVGHNCESGPPNDHPSQVWFNLVQWFQRSKCENFERMMNAKMQVITKAHVAFGQGAKKDKQYNGQKKIYKTQHKPH